jgi:predicted RNA-binding Zn-ribbon protein involved in translation (DUF1610 family)
MTIAVRVAIRCPQCGAAREDDGAACLRQMGMLRREGRPDPAMVLELLQAAQARMVCPECGRRGQLCSEITDDFDVASANCRHCGGRIPAARLALFPATTLCAACQHEAEKAGGSGDEDGREFCPHCGRVVRLQPSPGPVTRYRWHCTACGTVEIRD